MSEKGLKYTLEVLIPDQLPRKVEVIDHLFAGLDPRSDIILIDPKVKNRHFLFQKKDNVLSVQLLGPDRGSYLNQHAMEKGRHYVLDDNDRLEAGRVTIHIRVSNDDRPHDHIPRRVLQFDTLHELESELNLSHPKTPPPVIRPKKKMIARSEYHESTPILVHLKVQALMLDFHLTYVLVVVLAPLFHQTQTLTQLIGVLPAFSFLRFVVFVWLFKVVTSLLFSKSPGEALVGLTNREKNFLKRFASIFFLSLHDQKKDFFFFTFMRKIGFVFLILLCLAAPFFLPAPFSTQVTKEKEKTPTLMTLQTQTVQGYSRDLGLSLKAEIAARYYLTPVFNRNNKRDFALHDIESGDQIKIQQVNEIGFDEIEKTLQLGNPFFQKLSQKSGPKELVSALLLFAPLQIGPLYQWLGPYWGSAFAVKKEIIQHLQSDEAVTLNTYSESLPLIKLQTQHSELILLFAREKLISFKITSPVPYNQGLDQVLHHSVLTQFYLDETNDSGVSNGEVDMLTAQDDWSRGKVTGPLTYFQNEAKKLSKSNAVLRESGILFREKKKEIFLRELEQLGDDHRDETLAKSKAEIKNLLSDAVPTNDRKSSGTKNVRSKSKPAKNSRRR